MTMTSPFELAASARRYSSEAILCLECAPGTFAFFNRAFEFLGTSEDPDIRPWLALGREFAAHAKHRRPETYGVPVRKYTEQGNAKVDLGDLDI